MYLPVYIDTVSDMVNVLDLQLLDLAKRANRSKEQRANRSKEERAETWKQASILWLLRAKGPKYVDRRTGGLNDKRAWKDKRTKALGQGGEGGREGVRERGTSFLKDRPKYPSQSPTEARTAMAMARYFWVVCL